MSIVDRWCAWTARFRFTAKGLHDQPSDRASLHGCHRDGELDPTERTAGMNSSTASANGTLLEQIIRWARNVCSMMPAVIKRSLHRLASLCPRSAREEEIAEKSRRQTVVKRLHFWFGTMSTLSGSKQDMPGAWPEDEQLVECMSSPSLVFHELREGIVQEQEEKQEVEKRFQDRLECHKGLVQSAAMRQQSRMEGIRRHDAIAATLSDPSVIEARAVEREGIWAHRMVHGKMEDRIALARELMERKNMREWVAQRALERRICREREFVEEEG